MAPTADAHVAFLGLAERVSLVGEAETTVGKWNVLGLKNAVLANFFPLNLVGYYLGFAVRYDGAITNLDLRIRADSGEQVAQIQFVPLLEQPVQGASAGSGGLPFLQPPQGWAVVFVRLGDVLVVPRPGRYFATLVRNDGSEETVGELAFILVDPPPLTPERIAAIKSDPYAAKAVRAEIGCSKCTSKLRVYAALERNSALENEGYVWYQDIPERFVCACGTMTLDVSSMKRNFFALLGRTAQPNIGQISLVPQYEESALNHLRVEFLRLLDTNPPEETLQKFIERNPVLLHPFPAQQLFFKPPILTFFKADFAIVTPQKELILIEIETTRTKLMKKDGGQAAQLNHAFDQVRGWLHKIDEHRGAVLDSLNIKAVMVSKIRGVVIAGRDGGYNEEHLRRLKGIDHGQVTFLTFDDLASILAALISQMKSL